MAKVNLDKDGKYKLRGSKDTDLEGIDDKKYDVFTEEEKLTEAKAHFPTYNWFVSFTIKDKDGNVVRDLPEYTIKFDKPDGDNLHLYYYLDEAANPLSHDTEDKNGKKRVKAKLKIGDPPLGSVP
jgi:hypothetical protein